MRRAVVANQNAIDADFSAHYVIEPPPFSGATTMSDPQHPDPPITFRDVQPRPTCPTCSAPPLTATGGQYTCKSGHTWPVSGERTFKL